jgi:hypothetical protein
MRVINRNNSLRRRRACLADILRDAELSDAFSRLQSKYDKRIPEPEIPVPDELSFEALKFYRDTYPIKRLNAKVIYSALKSLGCDLPTTRGAVSVDSMLRDCSLPLDVVVSFLQKNSQ